MKFLFYVLIICSITSEDYTINFSTSDGDQGWVIVNDDVMGGRSTSFAFLKENSLVFKGNVSLENNGGFASIRGPYQKRDLSQFETVIIRCRGTARKFAISLDNSRAWYRPNYKFEFTPEEQAWTKIEIPLREFKESRVGEYSGQTMTNENLKRVIRMGIILYDKKEGPFDLEIDYIRFK